MKRLIIVASLAILAVGCQKTFVENEVLTPIGFNTEVGKQTRAIANDANGAYPEQPFGVYSYGYQSANDDEPSKPMQNVQMAKSGDVYKAAGNVKYYWPNNAATTLNFYAYSPYIGADALAADDDKKMTVTTALNHSETTGFTFGGYVHSNPYVDFMIADDILGATYRDQDGTTKNGTNLESVPVVFNHKMTQVVFNVADADPDDGVNFKVNSITLTTVYDEADFIEKPQSGSSWTGLAISSTNAGEYDVFPVNDEEAQNVPLTTTGVTMIPQTLANQKLVIEYVISGTGVATETVTVTKSLAATITTTDESGASVTENLEWKPNMMVTYNLKIGVGKEISFTPSVSGWDTTSTNDVQIVQ